MPAMPEVSDSLAPIITNLAQHITPLSATAARRRVAAFYRE
jgi:hypothetical protein